MQLSCRSAVGRSGPKEDDWLPELGIHGQTDRRSLPGEKTAGSRTKRKKTEGFSRATWTWREAKKTCSYPDEEEAVKKKEGRRG